MKFLLVCLGLFLSVNLFHEKTLACNAYHGGGFGYMDNPGGYQPHIHMNVHGHGGYGGYGYNNGYNGFGGFMDSFLRSGSDIGTGGHHQHGRSSLIPISRHRHIHRVHKRSAHYGPHLRPSIGFYMGGSSGPYSYLTICLSAWVITEVVVFLLFMATIMTAFG